jgi:ABC-type lipoprotein release transport system permease subunit
MDIICKTAWRNIFRNTRRTIITATAISIGIAGLIVTDAFMKGMMDNLIRNGTTSFIGDAQIHSRAYKNNPETEHTLPEYDTIENRLSRDPEIRAYSPRIISMGLVSSAQNSESVEVWGVDPEKEQNVTIISERISQKSRFLPNKNSLLLGKKTAEDLGVTTGDHLILTLAEAESGARRQEYMRVDGIYSFGSDEMDGMVALMHESTARSMLGLASNEYNRIALTLQGHPLKIAEDTLLTQKYSQSDVQFETWDELLPQLSSLMELTDISMLILGAILFVIVSFTIVNTLFMAIYERFFEFGVLKSLGTTPQQIIRMILYEAGFIALIGSVIGMIIAGFSLWILSRFGISYQDIEFSGMTFYEKIYPIVTLRQFIIYPVVISLLTVLISLYPARYIGIMPPSEAMKKSI